MEKRDFWCLPLRTHTDEVFKVTYLKVIGPSIVESLKIPTTLDKFKSKHLLNPQYLLHVEVIKTRKNWILKNVLSYKQVMTLESYHDFVHQAALINVIIKHTHEDEETKLLEFLITYFQSLNLKEITLEKFELDVMTFLGYK